MPFKSEAQRRKFYVMEDRGEISKGTTERWEDETKDKTLPERLNKKESAFARAVVATLDKSARVDPQKVEMIKSEIARLKSGKQTASLQQPKVSSALEKSALMNRMGLGALKKRLIRKPTGGDLGQLATDSRAHELIRDRDGRKKQSSAEVAGAALWGSDRGYAYLGGILKEAVERRKLAADPLEEQRKQQIHEQQMQFSEDKHEVELQQMQMNMESQQASQKMKAQQTEDKFKQDSVAKKQEAAQVQQMQQPPAPNSGQQNTKRRQNLMTSQSPPAPQQ